MGIVVRVQAEPATTRKCKGFVKGKLSNLYHKKALLPAVRTGDETENQVNLQ